MEQFQQGLGLTVVIFLVLFGIALLVGAIILRAACWLFNKMAGGEGSPGSVPSPGFGKAMLMVLVIGIIQVVAGIVMGILLANAGMGIVMLQLVSTPISFLVAAGMISALLPTSFSRGLGVALCQFIISILILVFVFLIFGVIGAILFA
jgi:hypothetical protein